MTHAIATIHSQAHHLPADQSDQTDGVVQQAIDNFESLRAITPFQSHQDLASLEEWTKKQGVTLHDRFHARRKLGWVRECHGDLHCNNIVRWENRWTPFDGVEFSRDLSWIDVMSDVAFLVMDLSTRSHSNLGSVLLSAYVEETGDYHGLVLLRWYMVYRAMVRAKVAAIRSMQLTESGEVASAIAEADRYIRFASKLTRPESAKLWITHGVSGSGKITGSQWAIKQEGMVRIRSDLERKRLFKRALSQSFSDSAGQGLYSSRASEATYRSLWMTARELLMAGFSVIVDATFLKKADRDRFRSVANSLGIEFRILSSEADLSALLERIEHRRLHEHDASDATERVVRKQLETQDPLTEDGIAFNHTRNSVRKRAKDIHYFTDEITGFAEDSIRRLEHDA